MTQWTYEGKPFTEADIDDYVGFVYLITEIPTGKKYVGKKIFYNKVSKPPLKGKSRRRITKKSSDWETYFGSNEELKKAVDENGPNMYKREILHLCRSKAEMGYLESKEIFLRDALLKEDYFNSWVSARIQRNQLKSLLSG